MHEEGPHCHRQNHSRCFNMDSRELMTQRDRIKLQIEALERCLDTDGTANRIDMMLPSSSSDSEQSYDEGPEDSEQRLLGMEQLVAKRYQIQQEIEEIEGALDQDMSCVKMEFLSQDDENDTGSAVESNGEDSDEFGLPENAETCLQLNLVYQEVLQEKLTELEHLLVENQEQQKELMTQVCGPDTPQASSSGLPPLKVFLGNFMKPYFKDRVTGLGPPANPETREKMNKGTRTYDEMKIKRWEGWQKTLLFSSVISDSMKRQLQPKLSKVEYLNEKMINADDVEKQILQKQINQIEREIEDISSMTEEQLMGSRHAYHDWEKIANIDFEGTRSAEDMRRFWENYLHPSINKSSWKEDEIEKLKGIVEKHNHCNWDQIAEELGTNRTAFMCLQTHQRYIHKGFKKKAWTKEEDQVLKELVEKMRIGNFIPYTQISYFIEGREAAQLIYRWTQVLDPNLRKGHWTKEEDEMLLKAVAKYGVRDWWKIRNDVPGRNDGQCRDRYLDCLSGDVKKGRWSQEEEAMLINLVEKYGAGRWSKIASEIPNRIDSQCLQKWKSMTRYRCKKNKCHKNDPLKKRERKRKKVERRIKRQREEEEDIMTSSEEGDIVFMDSEEELAEDESDLEQICREEYILPRIEEWIPKKYDLLPRLDQRALQTVQTKLSNQITSQGKVTQGRACSVNSLVLPHFPTGVCNTIVDQFGGLVTSNMGMQPAQKDHRNEKDVIKVSLCEVRNLLRWNQDMNPRHRIRRESQRKNSTNSKGDGPGQDGRPECIAMLNNELLLAITPWVGNLLVTLASRLRKHCQADIVRETAESLGLTSTPVFSLFLKILSIDAEGCKKVIEGRKMKESGISGKQVPAVTPSLKTKPPMATSHNRTVAQLLYEKRRQEYKKKKEDQKKTQLFMPYLMIPQSMVFTQPLLQVTQPPSTAADYISSVANSEEKAGAQQSQKRIRRPTEKALALKADSKVKASKKSPNHKKACLKNICPKVRTDGDSSQVSLTPPFINWIVTPNGILPVNGIGIQIPVVTQPPAVGTKEVFSDMSCLASTNSFISQQSSLTFPVKAEPGAEPPSKLLKVSPSPSIKAASPVSSTISVMEERAVLKPAPPSYTSTNTPTGGVIYTVPNTTGLIHSTSSSRLVSLSQSNTSCPQITLHTLTPTATSTILSLPVSVNTVPSIPVPPHTVSQKVTHVNPELPLSQHLPTLPVFQPHTPGISGNCPGSPVAPPALGVSPSQQRVVHILQPRHPPLMLSSKHGMQPKPEPISFDPSLMFPEDVSQLKDWMKGAMVLPQLDMTIPYLPPFFSSLTTLATLLKCKMDLRMCALPLVTTNAESYREEPPENAVRQLVAERLSSNPAYVLLKARFLSCFTLPAFVATIPPCRKAKPPTFITSEDSEHEEETQPGKYGGLLRIDGEGAVAAEFSGISTRH